MNNFEVNDSIAAIASPAGSSARGVIRLSGPAIDKALQKCFESQSVGEPWAEAKRPTRVFGEIMVAAPLSRVAADLYYWPTAASYTRQRSAEIHCVGSPPILNEIMRVLGESGVRQAQPGEFTMRAFLAGRIDLTRAEAVLGVIDSRSEREMDVALTQLAGGLSGPLSQLQDELLEVLANVEAGLDFVEDDIEFISRDAIQASIDRARATLDDVIEQMSSRHLDTARKKVVLRGRPNAGKSCLQNALCQEQVAIVSDVAGTTRDYLVGQMKLGQQIVDVIDTAGTMVAQHSIESDGNDDLQKLAESAADRVIDEADVVIYCLDGSVERDELELAWIERLNQQPPFASKAVLVFTKSDLSAVNDANRAAADLLSIRVSSVSGEGLELLRDAIQQKIDTGDDSEFSQVVSSTANRCRESLILASNELEQADSWCRAGHGDEIIAASLRTVLDQLAVVTGKVFTDDILDRVFSNFCIGK